MNKHPDLPHFFIPFTQFLFLYCCPDDQATVGEYRLGFIPLDSDMLSLELEGVFKEVRTHVRHYQNYSTATSYILLFSILTLDVFLRDFFLQLFIHFSIHNSGFISIKILKLLL